MTSRAVPCPGLVAGALVLTLLSACERAPAALALPRPENLVDALILARVEDALAACERGETAARLELAKVYDANDLDELALRVYDLVLAGDAAALGEPEARVRYHRARVLAELGRVEEALAGFDSALELARDYAPLHARRGELLFELGRTAEARAAFARALELEPAGLSARLGLAKLQLFEGQPAAAREALEALAREFPRERSLPGLLARAWRALGDEARARAVLADAPEGRGPATAPDDPWTAEVLTRATGVEHAVLSAGAAMGVGDFEGALAILEPLYLDASDDFALIEALARARNAARRHARALELVEHGRALHPDRFQLELQAAIATFGLSRLDEARVFAERARALNPGRAATHALLGEVLFRQGEFAAAEESLLAALERGERNPRVEELLGEVRARRAEAAGR